jgi:ABC-type branched-subunit amino acid transport system ATPase component
MPLIASVSDELLAMDLGRVVLRGAPDDVLSDPRVVESYLGSSEAAIARSGRAR